MRRFVSILVVLFALGVAPRSRALQTARAVCVGNGWLLSTTGNIPVSTISEGVAALTSAGAATYSSGVLTENVGGLVCSYTIVTGATNSFLSIGANGTGAATQTLTPVTTNSPSCSPQFVAHFMFAYGVNGSTFVETDPNITTSGSCYPQ